MWSPTTRFCVRGKLSALNLLRGRYFGFLPREGGTLHRPTPYFTLIVAEVGTQPQKLQVLKPNSIKLSGRRQARSWSKTCSELEFGLSSTSLAAS